MNHLKTIIKWIVNLLTIILVVILIVVIYGKLSLTFSNKKYANYFGYTLFEVASGSMRPTLDINDVVLVKISKDNLNANDKSIKDIVNGEFFMKLCESFSCNSIANGKPKACSRACGKNIDLHKNGHTTEIKYERK